MLINFHGAAETVTGSKHLITTQKGTTILLDCGMFQGEGPETGDMNRHFGFDPQSIDYLILSHAHIDHSGLIPALVKQGFKGRIFSTAATRDLCRVMLNDSAEIQEEEARRAQRHGHGYASPLYTLDDVRKTMNCFHALNYNKDFQISEELSVRLTDAGHIIGSAAIHLQIKERERSHNLSFTGDIGRYGRNLLCDPQSFPQADYIICESTYGNTIHQSLESAEELFRTAILETCGLKKGKLIIPAFSLGRTQELVYMLNKFDFEREIPKLKVFVDSPLAIEATEVVKKHPECFDEETRDFMKRDPDPFEYQGLHFIEKVEDSIALNNLREPCIIIASSGMMEAGRIMHHVVHHIEDEKNTILLTSFMPEGSHGGKLLRGDKKIKIWDRVFDVKADVIPVQGLSAHADKNEIIRYLSCQDVKKIKKIFLVHGEAVQQNALKDELLNQGYHSVLIPGKGERYDTGEDR